MLPGGDLVSEDLLIGDAAVETLGRQDAEFRLRQIEPAAVLWRVMPFEPLDQPPGFGGRGDLAGPGLLFGLRSIGYQPSLSRRERNPRRCDDPSPRRSASLRAARTA